MKLRTKKMIVIEVLLLACVLFVVGWPYGKWLLAHRMAMGMLDYSLVEQSYYDGGKAVEYIEGKGKYLNWTFRLPKRGPITFRQYMIGVAKMNRDSFNNASWREFQQWADDPERKDKKPASGLKTLP